MTLKPGDLVKISGLDLLCDYQGPTSPDYRPGLFCKRANESQSVAAWMTSYYVWVARASDNNIVYRINRSP